LHPEKAPCGGEKAGRSPVDRGKRGIKRSVVVDGRGIPLGSVSAPANHHDSPLLAPTLEAARTLGLVVEGASVNLDRGYDSKLTRMRLLERKLVAEISARGRPAPLNATRRWVVERTNSWQAKLAHKKLLWCTERRSRVVDFWVAFSEVVIIVRRLIREGWIRYRWEGRPSRRP
jgi:IS5 family transposase